MAVTIIAGLTQLFFSLSKADIMSLNTPYQFVQPAMLVNYQKYILLVPILW